MLDDWQKLLTELEVFNTLEVIAVATALIYIYLASKGNRWCFLFGLISSSIYVYITLKLNFYFDVGINAYYVIMSFCGWFTWTSQTKYSALAVERISSKKLVLTIVGGAITFLTAAVFADFHSSAELVYFDAFTTVFAVIATYMVVKRQIENWLIWIVVDAVAAGMYLYKELYFTAFLFIIYTIVAIFGYSKWKKLLAK
ncbi:nicotinamide riboside transporter PnuC [Vicingaceae bacterium]|nr:nicotinamide riboside transporter PnuC [Vicingaceae bacterium]